MKIETHNIFSPFLFCIISVYSIKIIEARIFQQAIFIFWCVIALVSHRHLSKIIYNFQQNFSYSSNSIIEYYILKLSLSVISILGMVICHVSYDLPSNFIILRTNFLFYKKSLIGIWNI